MTNDGYTMGTNRKPVAGSQLVEALDLFHDHVRQGKEPPESRHSFCIPAEWIKTLDPRIKDRIRAETRADMAAKEADDRARQLEKLNAQIAAKKLTPTERDERLVQHADLWFSKTENEIARKIERAHLYSFNLPNYRSSLTLAQIKAWKNFAATRVREGAGDTTLEAKYRAIAAARTEELDEMLSSLDPRYALELDGARQFLAGVPAEEFERHPHLRTLQEIIASQQKLPRVPLKGLLRLNKDTIAPSEFPDIRFRVLGVNNETGVFLNETLPGSEIKQRYYRVKPGEFCYNPYRINVGSIGLNEFDYDNQIISGAYVVFGTDEREVHPQFLAALFKCPQFLAYVNEKASGGVRMNFKFEDLEDWEMPLLPMHEQEQLVAEHVKCFRFKHGFDLVAKNFSFEVDEDLGTLKPLNDAIIATKNGWSPQCNGGETPVLTLACLKGGTIDLAEVKYTSESRPDLERFIVREDDFFYSRGNTPQLVALAGIAKDVRAKVVFPDLLTRVSFNHQLILPEFAVWLFNSKLGRRYFGAVPEGGAPSMVKVSQDYMANFQVPFLGDIERQRRIVAKIHEQQKLLEQLVRIVDQRTDTLRKTLARIWES